MALNRQVMIYGIDTGNFYSMRERRLHWLNHKIREEKKTLVEESKKIEKKFESVDIDKNSMLKMGDDELDDLGMKELACRYREIGEIIKMKNVAAKNVKDKLLALLSNKVEANIASNGTHHVRELAEDTLNENKVIAVFESYFTRTIGAKQNELCEDFMVVTKYYDDVIKDLIYYGFIYKGEKYVYFTSSAGQIRTKKCVFVKESTWLKHQKTLMCGLTIDDINAKGGNNPNKHLAYLALANSATDVWEEFDIDKTIVIDDFGTDVFGEFDFIDDVTYSVERKKDFAPIEHTDGAGMMLPDAFGAKQKNKMVRLPWVKGLLGVFDFKKFIEVNGCSPVIKDIYGKEHDVIAEDIQLIFSKSQFKLWKYYDSWEHYKEMYKKYDCTAGITNEEEDMIKDATINYQMLQSLTDVADDEIVEIARSTTESLENICSSLESIKGTMGITPYNKYKTAFQRAVELYPDLLNDEYAKKHIRNIKDSMVKRGRAGKLNVHGKYTFVLPDFYAACQHWFMGIDSPDGLLDDGEVFCWLFRKNEKLDCLRSPHLYKEHPIRRNVACHSYGERQSNIREWFCTDAVYTSCKDLISRILQFDVDGDKLLVVADKKLIEVAERNMKGIVPLYYNMKKAESVKLTNEAIYKGLNAAFTGGNIGAYSNNISKIWNSDVFINGSDDEKNEAIDIVKLLCMENNYVIDYAKTLYQPERPDDIDEKIKAFTKESLPHFFKYAKDKGDNQVVDRNMSFVNKLEDKKIIPNPKISCKKLGIGKVDYELMMSDINNKCIAKLDNGKLVKEETEPLIVKYCDFDREYYFSVDAAISCDDEQQSNDKFMKKILKHRQMAEKIKFELSQFGYDDMEIADRLVSFLYNPKYGKNRMNKTALWMCYGDYIVENLERYFKPQTKVVKCVDCGEWFEVSIFDSATCRCHECQKEHRKEYDNERKAKMDTKIITCVDCGKEFEVKSTNRRTKRCKKCQGIANNASKSKWWGNNVALKSD